ncbi:hypothetical protein G6F56_008863 [Rhizopus delemar]|nr:hypothetical protein G6F56_008863 [Rhizopus delemar]
MTIETSEQYQQTIKDVQNNIEQIQKTLKARSKTKDTLNNEYDKLAQLQLDYSQFLKINWETHRKETRASRNIDIQSRQAEFDKELELQDKERRKKWTQKKPTKKEKIALCDQLVEALKDEGKLEILNNHSFEIDTSLLILPSSLLESFWALNLDPPVMRSEIDSTIQLLIETKSGLELKEKEK